MNKDHSVALEHGDYENNIDLVIKHCNSCSFW
ncbi:hypothetical protein DEAC_c41000 [Desulfosporosinus acididurans]|uniref:Uncharacterized protein n=1 Tax=Desulfosporosinus acididurans TaxID=476652 RepID=A0A0J1FKH1_9FIRM|nr:hypothetical protein DEAC_c41000 [Desulfosporosinus acididurans]